MITATLIGEALSEEMFCDGYRNIFNIDTSYVVAEQMAHYYKNKAIEMTY